MTEGGAIALPGHEFPLPADENVYGEPIASGSVKLSHGIIDALMAADQSSDLRSPEGESEDWTRVPLQSEVLGTLRAVLHGERAVTIMSVLMIHPGLTLPEIGGFLNVDPSELELRLLALQRHGLVEASTDTGLAVFELAWPK